MMLDDRIANIFTEYNQNDAFSGVFSVRNSDGVMYEQACGYRNRAEKLSNEISTAFGIASGTKLFTGLAICKLIDEGKLVLADKVWDIVPYDLKMINKDVTVFHLLTHTAGLGEYIDEESPDSNDNMISLYKRYPVYLWDSLTYYLPMFSDIPAKFKPGERFEYSNDGYILLGLVIEAISGMRCQDYVTEQIIRPCGLTHTEFYRLDRLPHNTAYGYLYDGRLDEWYSNIYRMPIIGGSDGGLFTCASDLDKLWRAVFSGHILSDAMHMEWIMPRIEMGDEKGHFYGFGMYQYKAAAANIYYAVGCDYGVEFFSMFIPQHGIVASALGNTEMDTRPLLEQLFSIEWEYMI